MDHLQQHFPITKVELGWHGQISRAYYRSARRIGFFILLISISLCCSVVSAASQVLVVTSGSTDVYQEVINAFDRSFRSSCRNCGESSYTAIFLDQVNASDLQNRMAEDWRLIVTIGRQASTEVAGLNPAVPVLHTLIPHETYLQLPKTSRSPSVSAIFIDQPIQRRLLLLKLAMPGRTKVGVLISRSSRDLEKEIARDAKLYGLKPVFETLENEEQLGSVLKKLLDRSEVLLAIPDPFIFNRNTVRNILLSSYHHQIPVIGFSAAYVKAGASIAVFSTPEEIGRQTGEVVANYINGDRNRLPPPSYPKYFSVVCNQNVSNSLQINLPTAEQLEARLQEESR
jgi:putative ABC transport system substrate-binding protein